MNLVEAERVAVGVIDCVKMLCDRIEVAGAVRRRKAEVHDVDIVLIPQPMMWSTIVNRVVRMFDGVVEKGGDKMAVLQLPVNNERCQVDLWVATHDNWGIVLMARTGSAEFNMKLAKHAHEIGRQYRISMGVTDEGGKILGSKTEEEVFEALKLKWIAPEKREG